MGLASPRRALKVARLVLASSSRYRRELLQRLRLAFDVASPAVDETALPGEAPGMLAARLAQAKARAVALQLGGDTWALGSDQVAEVEGRALGKPGGRDAAIARRPASSPALCLAHADGRLHAGCDLTEVHFRVLEAAEIGRYVDAEQPFDCAGSFKSEGLGIALFERIDNRDPTALIGLPLIATCRLLRAAGFALP